MSKEAAVLPLAFAVLGLIAVVTAAITPRRRRTHEAQQQTDVGRHVPESAVEQTVQLSPIAPQSDEEAERLALRVPAYLQTPRGVGRG
ncbi:hypothetical protein GCM10012275_42910 [Longimycelium tulufanense]|uniref:Uncharacterized protein n=1 Tax=Longimycelium tulufanense TaxID=907463 RepID=A0A8J3CFG0_9PSEU|nr:hypothetical protein GCM10012275_42910 [Longimycelium tulufanense]